MPTYDGIGSSITHRVEVVGDSLFQDVDGGTLSTKVPVQIFSNYYASPGSVVSSRQLRFRVQPDGESNVSNSYVTDMGVKGADGSNYFFITAPQNTSNVGDQNTFVISSTSNVGIGTTDPVTTLQVVGDIKCQTLTASNIVGGSPLTITSDENLQVNSNLTVGTSNLFVNNVNGRIGIGTDSPERRLTLKTNWSTQQYDGLFMRDANDNGFVILAAGSTDAGGARSLGYMRLYGTDGVATNGIFLQGSGSSYINGGNVGIGTASPQTTFQVVSNGTSQADKGAVAAIATDNTSFGGNYALLGINCKKAASNAYRFLQCNSGYGTSGSLDAEFILYGNGNATADGSWTGGGADYAEMFEWEDGNPENEDRIGLCVKLSENKIKLMEENDDTSLILGIVSKTGGFIGDAAELKWNKKYLKDDFGRYLEEEYYIYNWTDEDGKFHSYAHDDVPSELIVPESKETIKSNRRILNPEYNPSDEYIPRSNRIEWETIGLFGKIRIRKGQPVKNTWIKLRNISEHVEEWFVR